MDIRFDICNKKRLGTLFRRGDTGIGGKKAKVNIDLRAVNKLEVNHKTEFMTMTDDVKIVNNNTGEILIPFKPELIDVGTNSFEVVAYMENGDIKTSQTYVYSVSESIGNNRPTVSTRTVNKPNILTSDINARVTEYTIGDIRVYPIVVDMDTVDDINTTLKFKQYDFGTSHLLLQLFEGDTPLHLKNTSVVASFLNAYNDLIIDTVSYTNEETIISEIDGVIKVLIPKDVIRYEGDVKCEVLLFDTLENRTTSPRISFSIVESLNNHEDSSEIIDTEKYTVLSTLMKNVGVLQESANTLITQNKTLSVDLRSSETIRVSNENTRITNENKRIEQHTNRLSEMTNSITNIEKRFTTLTTSQQQDAELIDARDGEDSLKLRLDRDLAKGKVIEEDVEGIYITVTDSVAGNISNKQILGNTVQNATNLADIKSVGVATDDGHFKMSILSCGKNLFDNRKELGGISSDTGENQSSSNLYRSVDYIKIDGAKNYVFSTSNTNGLHTTFNVYFYDKNKKFLGYKAISKIDTSNIFANACYIRFSKVDTYEWQLEEGIKATQYEPPQHNKCDILLPCQLDGLEKGDRLYYDEVEKAWCIDKVIKDYIVNGSESWTIPNDGVVLTTHRMSMSFPDAVPSSVCVAEGFVFSKGATEEKEKVYITSTPNLSFTVLKEKFATVQAWKDHLKSNPILVKYQSITPTKIVLPLDVQIQLNSFFGTTHMWLESGDVEGTIKATVPKSLGASVNSLVNKTDILGDRVSAIEGLKDSQNMDYETDKGYLVAEKTVNGVVKDWKVQGRTLVNLWDSSTFGGGTGEGGIIIYYNNKRLTKGVGKVTIKIDTGNIDTTYLKWAIYRRTNNNVNVGYFMIYSSNFDTKLVDFSTDTVSDFDFYAIYINNHNGTSYVPFDEKQIKITILEGDHTQNPPSYFEGLKSVGQDVDAIEISSVNKNLISQKNDYTIDHATGKDSPSTVGNNIDYVSVKPGLPLVFSRDGVVRSCVKFYYNANKELIGKNNTDTNGVFTVPNNGCSYLRLSWGTTIEDGIYQLEVGTQVTKYEPHKSHKKQLLYYNELGELKPIPQLREWDSIEEKNDKTIVTIGSKEVVLNGSEGQDIRLTTSNGGFTRFALLDKNIKINSIGICDKLKSINPTGTFTEEGFYCGSDGSVQIVISNDKASTLEAFKTFVSQNPYTFVTQLATPKIYECPNLNLNSYSNETIITLNELVINPHLEFSITSHINSVVAELKEQTRKNTEDLDKVFRQVTYNVDTSKGYEVIEHTNDGVVKNVNIQGRTLVNLSPKINKRYNECNIVSNNGFTVWVSMYGFTEKILCRLVKHDESVQYLVIQEGEGNSCVYLNKDIYKSITQVYFDTTAPTNFENIKVMIFEGDYTNLNLGYFEGLKSVGQDVDGIEVSTRKNDGNLFDGELIDGRYNTTTGNFESTSGVVCTNKKTFVIPGQEYEITKALSGGIYRIFFYKDDTFISSITTGSYVFTVPLGVNMINVQIAKTHVSSETFEIVKKGNLGKGEHKSHKKQLLYYNELGELCKICKEQPLREWDSIEEKNDKTIVTIGSGEVVLNGGESEAWYKVNGDLENTMQFGLPIDNSFHLANVLCDKFTQLENKSIGTDVEAITMLNNSASKPVLYVRISRSKLSTQDLAGFKKWLQANPITVVHQLATPKVYECPNLNISSYSNETMISLNSGAINPRMEFSITSHINELVKNNQARINELEQRIMNMFKSVLSGDMQSLAYELYPGDFKTDIAYDVELL